MRPVDQTTFGVPGGNCFSACIASILELAIEDVPYFMGDFQEPDQAYADRFEAWLLPRGFYPMYFNYSKHASSLVRGYHLLGGRSPRGPHAVVARAGVMIHDPHPSRVGLTVIEDFTILVPYFGDITEVAVTGNPV
jgi:hypothetical protein